MVRIALMNQAIAVVARFPDRCGASYELSVAPYIPLTPVLAAKGRVV
jgi:hypothetical protein